MFRKPLFVVFLILFSLLLFSCSKFRKIQKSEDNDYKYEKAVEYYEDEDYYRALQLFDQLIPVFRGTEKAEELYYLYAYAHYNQEDYILASYYFNRFTKNFPRSKYAEECAFMSAYCKYLDSPRYSLDQTNTYDAIRELQLFINKYPQSERLEECNKLIDDLRGKLEKKQFEIAELYYNIEDYQAAVTAFKNLIYEFPDTEYKEEAMFHILKAYYRYASRSIEERKEERFEDALEAFADFVLLFPESDFSKEANKMKNESIDALKNMNDGL